MIQEIPNDIQQQIIYFLPSTHYRQVIISNIFHNSINVIIHEKIIDKMMKLALYTRLVFKIRILFRDISHNLINYEYFLYNYGSGFVPFNNQCLIYAPLNQGHYRCRFCHCDRFSHKYIKLMNIYRDLIYKYETIIH